LSKRTSREKKEQAADTAMWQEATDACRLACRPFKCEREIPLKQWVFPGWNSLLPKLNKGPVPDWLGVLM
jgi:hypothetical protein